MNLTKLASVYADELEYIVTLFSAEGINYNPNELLINIDDAWRAIACYLWLDYDSDNIEVVKADYQTLICRLAMAYFNNAQIEKGNLKGTKFITQQSQGSRSVTYRSGAIEIDSNGLTAEVKAALPVRKLRVL